jgi:hypothetical protein
MAKHSWIGVVLFLLAAAGAARGQGIHPGLKVGLPLTAPVEELHTNPVISSPIRRYSVGLTGEIALVHGFSVQADILYKRFGYEASYSCGLRCQPFVVSQVPPINGRHVSDAVKITANAWEFPAQVKYWTNLPYKPYVAGGLSLRLVSPASVRCFSTDTRFGSGVPGGDSRATTEEECGWRLRTRGFAGIVVTTGIEMRRSFLRLNPEFRYTRWFQTEPDFANFLPTGPNGGFTANQAEVLLGFSF